MAVITEDAGGKHSLSNADLYRVSQALSQMGFICLSPNGAAQLFRVEPAREAPEQSLLVSTERAVLEAGATATSMISQIKHGALKDLNPKAVDDFATRVAEARRASGTGLIGNCISDECRETILQQLHLRGVVIDDREFKTMDDQAIFNALIYAMKPMSGPLAELFLQAHIPMRNANDDRSWRLATKLAAGIVCLVAGISSSTVKKHILKMANNDGVYEKWRDAIRQEEVSPQELIKRIVSMLGASAAAIAMIPGVEISAAAASIKTGPRDQRQGGSRSDQAEGSQRWSQRRDRSRKEKRGQSVESGADSEKSVDSRGRSRSASAHGGRSARRDPKYQRSQKRPGGGSRSRDRSASSNGSRSNSFQGRRNRNSSPSPSPYTHQQQQFFNSAVMPINSSGSVPSSQHGQHGQQKQRQGQGRGQGSMRSFSPGNGTGGRRYQQQAQFQQAPPFQQHTSYSHFAQNPTVQFDTPAQFQQPSNGYQGQGGRSYQSRGSSSGQQGRGGRGQNRQSSINCISLADSPGEDPEPEQEREQDQGEPDEVDDDSQLTDEQEQPSTGLRVESFESDDLQFAIDLNRRGEERLFHSEMIEDRHPAKIEFKQVPTAPIFRKDKSSNGIATLIDLCERKQARSALLQALKDSDDGTGEIELRDLDQTNANDGFTVQQVMDASCITT